MECSDICTVVSAITAVISAITAIIAVGFSFYQWNKQSAESKKQNEYLRRTAQIEYLPQTANIYMEILTKIDTNDFPKMVEIFDKYRWVFVKFENYKLCSDIFSAKGESCAVLIKEDEYREPLRLLFAEMLQKLSDLQKEIDHISRDIS